MSLDPRRHAPATGRNRDAILAVLRRVLPPEGLVLEVASGTGEHATYFAPRLPHLRFQPTERDPALMGSILAWSAEAAAPNLLPPLALDAAAGQWPVDEAAAILCINMIHIAPMAACEGLLRGAARLLPPDGPLYLYGPFRIGGRHTAPSNESFDAQLRAQDPSWGVRDLDEVGGLAAAAGLALEETIAMPANNLSVIFRRATAAR
jgi:hypothetical protein